MSSKRVFISSTPEELEPHQAVAVDTIRELGLQPVLRHRDGVRGLNSIEACNRQVATADLVLVIVGHRRGSTPTPEQGGDGFHPWSWWQTRAAFEHGKRVAVIMAADTWRPELREPSANARAIMRDFRGEVARIAVFFDDDSQGRLRDLIEHELTKQISASARLDARLRRWTTARFPAHPYPVLLPYTSPALFTGRDHEIDELRQLLARPVPIIGLHAPSGTGKSSFLQAGLVSTLRAEGKPVAFDRHPCEPKLVDRLLDDLLDHPGSSSPLLGEHGIDDDPHAFVDRLRAVQRLADGVPPVLVLDQFEDLLRHADRRQASRVIGKLLAASVQRLPGLTEAPCRWLLAYRQEFHGEVFHWLADVLRDARSESQEPVASLPHDLSRPERFHAWALSPLGMPAPGTDGVAASARVFQTAIEKPLASTSENGERLYPWRFAGDGAARLAQAFGAARAKQRNAPLVPELQVVLAHLLERASLQADGTRLIEVPEDPGELIDRALEEHLQRSLDLAFTPEKRSGAKIADARIGRTRALLALRELADAHGRRDQGRTVASLARAIGGGGREVLEKLATPQTRVVLLESHGDEQVFVLSHDRMAEVVARLVDEGGTYAGLGVDDQLLGLRRFVALQRELFVTGEVEQATEVPQSHFSGIEQHTDALLWDDDSRRWWAACKERRRLDRRREWIRRGAAAATVALLTAVVWLWAEHIFERRELLETVVAGEPEAAFAALARLSAESGVDPLELSTRIEQREAPYDVVEHGLGGVDDPHRGPALLRVTELLLPLQQARAPEDPVWIAAIAWALDFFAIPDPALREPAIALRDRLLAPLRGRRPPPPIAGPGDPYWTEIPAGTFWMGVDEGEKTADGWLQEWPRHQVTVSTFLLMTHEVTTREYRRLVPDHRPEDAPELPAAYVSWYEAYTYAAWLGGRLPTEAEWEYSAWAGCETTYCKQDGSEATLSDVGWWPGNSLDPISGEPERRPVMQLAANPWGLHDIHGNVVEWTANWIGPFATESPVDPPGPTRSTSTEHRRTLRGGTALLPASFCVRWRRGAWTMEARVPHFGLRVALPEWSASS